MANFRKPPLRDKDYRRSFKGEMCWNCGRMDDTVVGAHIRWGHEAGIGQKPNDDLIVPLCAACHREQESQPGPAWWANCLKAMARRQYEAWKRQEDIQKWLTS